MVTQNLVLMHHRNYSVSLSEVCLASEGCQRMRLVKKIRASSYSSNLQYTEEIGTFNVHFFTTTNGLWETQIPWSVILGFLGGKKTRKEGGGGLYSARKPLIMCTIQLKKKLILKIEERSFAVMSAQNRKFWCPEW